jgi:hypothetical protein
VSRPDLLEHFRGDATGRALIFQTLEHLGFGPKEHLEQLAQLLGARLFLTGRLQGLTVFLGLVPQRYELLAGGRRLLRRGSEPARSPAWGHSRPWHARHASKLRRGRQDRQDGEHQHQRNCPAERHDFIPPAYPEHPIRFRVDPAA